MAVPAALLAPTDTEAPGPGLPLPACAATETPEDANPVDVERVGDLSSS